MATIKNKNVVFEILGKTISGIVATQADSQPRSQVYFTFSDGSSLELYSNEENIRFAKGLGEKTVDDIIGIVGKREHTTYTVFRPSYKDPRAEQRDLLSDT